MLTLIKREIYDNIPYFAGALLLSLMMVIIIISAAYTINSQEAYMICMVVSAPIIIIFLFGLTGMGLSQMYFDKSKKISVFLLTLAVTRNRVITARICAGILAILIFFLPLIIIAMILHPLIVPPIPIIEGIFLDVYVTAILLSLACYCIGLQTGWSKGRLTQALGGLMLTCILITIVSVKGFGMQISLLLILFIIASIIRVRQNFITTVL